MKLQQINLNLLEMFHRTLFADWVKIYDFYAENKQQYEMQKINIYNLTLVESNNIKKKT